MSWTTIHLLRHGVHDRAHDTLCGRMEGFPLGDAGARQARALGRGLAAHRLAAVYSSAVQRAAETAAIVASECDLKVQVARDLDEIDFGDWSGRSFADLEGQAEWAAWNSDRARRRAPGGESMLEAQARIARWLHAAAKRHRGEAIAAVSHADVIKAGVAHVLGLSLHFYDRFEIAPGSSTTIVATEGGLRLITLNEAPHG